MTFISYEFLAFFAVVLLAYGRLPMRAQNLWLLAASFFFYGWWDWRFLGLILGSSTIDYFAGLAASPDSGHSERTRRVAMWTSVASNLSLLGFFKYLGFFVESAQAGLAGLGLPWDTSTLNIILPVGISFYTFQTLSYTIDVWRGQLRPEKRFDTFLLFVSFFPQLVAGPIERASHLLPQLNAPRRPSAGTIADGFSLMLVGFFKKMVVADNMAPWVNELFRRPDPTAAEVCVAAVAFAFQIYGDFSGYTDIARGAARTLGFDLQPNFRTPYLAINPSDFWRRWHISLSSWLRDYLYISLGGNRKGSTRTRVNLMVTMLLGGLWHGANWTFLLWGAYQGALLGAHHAITHRDARKTQDARTLALPALAWRIALLFPLTCVGWLIFRSADIDELARMLVGLAHGGAGSLNPVMLTTIGLAALPLVILDLAVFRLDDPEPWQRWRWGARALFHVALFYCIVLFGSPYASSFIYLQF